MKLNDELIKPARLTPRKRDLAACAIGLALLMVWDTAGLDLRLVRLFGDAQGFAWKDHWFTSGVLHQGGRALGWAVMLAMLVHLRWRLPFAKAMTQRVAWWWVGTTLLCVLLIPLIKRVSLTSCPWSLAEFGGAATYVSHWAWGQADGGPGHCFPSGHASGAFSFLAGWWALRASAPRAARWWLVLTVVVGLVFGWGQMMRGAHYASHTLWTAWICWAVTVASWHLLRPHS